MPAYMNGKTGSWYVQCYYSDIDGNRKHKVKRGFATKGDALAWEADFLASADGSMSMPFEAFVKRYSEDVRQGSSSTPGSPRSTSSARR